MSPLEPEAGIWYALVWTVVIFRLISRRIHLGSWKHLQLDDYLILLAMATDTVLVACMHIVVNTSSNLIPPGDDVSKYTPEEIQSRIYGSKLVLVVEQMQLATTWLIKACLLTLYSRITGMLSQHKVVIATAYYVGFSFVIMEILYFGVWCRPFHEYWAVPTNSKQCSAATHHLITNAVLNISSDLIIISIPMPLLFKVKLPLKQKLSLCGVFLIGVFTITAAALNKYYSFTHPFGTEWTIWYLRESFTAILCANLPLTYNLVQRIFGLKRWGQSQTTGLGGDTTRMTQGATMRTDHRKSEAIPKGLFSESQEDIVNIEIEEIDQARFAQKSIEIRSSRSLGNASQESKVWESEDSKKSPDPYRVV